MIISSSEGFLFYLFYYLIAFWKLENFWNLMAVEIPT